MVIKCGFQCIGIVTRTSAKTELYAETILQILATSVTASMASTADFANSVPVSVHFTYLV